MSAGGAARARSKYGSRTGAGAAWAAGRQDKHISARFPGAQGDAEVLRVAALIKRRVRARLRKNRIYSSAAGSHTTQGGEL